MKLYTIVEVTTGCWKMWAAFVEACPGETVGRTLKGGRNEKEAKETCEGDFAEQHRDGVLRWIPISPKQWEGWVVRLNTNAEAQLA